MVLFVCFHSCHCALSLALSSIHVPILSQKVLLNCLCLFLPVDVSEMSLSAKVPSA